MMLRRSLLLASLTAGLFAALPGGFAQNAAPAPKTAAAPAQPEFNYGSSRNDGQALENRRFAAASDKIAEERVDAQAQLQRDQITCDSNDRQCMNTAQANYLKRTKQIDLEQVDAQATHQKNMIRIETHWRNVS